MDLLGSSVPGWLVAVLAGAVLALVAITVAAVLVKRRTAAALPRPAGPLDPRQVAAEDLGLLAGGTARAVLACLVQLVDVGRAGVSRTPTALGRPWPIAARTRQAVIGIP